MKLLHCIEFIIYYVSKSLLILFRYLPKSIMSRATRNQVIICVTGDNAAPSNIGCLIATANPKAIFPYVAKKKKPRYQLCICRFFRIDMIHISLVNRMSSL